MYRACGIDARSETGWSTYTIGLLVFNLAGAMVVYALQRLQQWLPLNPQHFSAVSADSSFNTAMAFVTNTDWQGYSGESTMGYLTQAAGLAVQNFLSAATGMAVAIDIGDTVDIHPKDKQTVGRRLALAARAVIHHEKIVYSGPAFQTAKREGSQVRLLFHYTGAGLTTRDGKPLVGFAVRGVTPNEWLWADAKIQDNAVVLGHKDLPEIHEVRYAWASNPIGNLANKDGLPALPFRAEIK